jgi:hypothetical protein
MTQFNTHKWLKNQYLKEAGLLKENQVNQVAQAIDDAIASVDDSLGYKEFALAVAKILKEEYGSHNFDGFMEVLHAELGMNESLNEAESSNIDKVDFAFIDGTTQFYGAYIYKDGGRPVGAGLPNTWSEKLRSTREVQDFLTSLGIDIEFNYYNLPEIFKALEAQGIKAEDSEFDVS